MELDSLRAAIRSMTPRTQLFKVLKEELTALGYWRNKPRGNPAKGFKVMKGEKNEIN
jgi:hypothetical protein